MKSNMAPRAKHHIKQDVFLRWNEKVVSSPINPLTGSSFENWIHEGPQKMYFMVQGGRKFGLGWF